LQEGLRTIGDTEVLKKIVSPRPDISERRQCELLGLNRSMLYYKPVEENPANLELMRMLDEEYLDHPTKGVLGMVDFLRALGILIGPKRVRRLLRRMGVMAIYPKQNLSKLGLAKYIHSYKLRGLEVTHSNHVWCIDITYIPMQKGFLYLTAIIDVYSRYIVGWDISNTLDAENSLRVLRKAIQVHGKPDIVNSDQGSQFTCPLWVDYLEKQEIIISMDGKGRALDNIWIERFWRTLKQEYVYICPAENGNILRKGLNKFINYYNNRRTHRSLDRKTPFDWYDYAA
jgi:putative transposase